MVGNVWVDRELDRLVYNIEDADYRLLSANSDVDQSTESDPTLKAAKGDHRSQRLFAELLSSTVSANKLLQEEWFKTALEYKVDWAEELDRRFGCGGPAGEQKSSLSGKFLSLEPKSSLSIFTAASLKSTSPGWPVNR